MTMDVGVDNVGYLPLTLTHIRERLATLPPALIPDEADALDEESVTDFTV